MQRLHIAVIDEELPYPLTSGKRIRTFNLLRRLARRHRITYVAHRNADLVEAEDAALALRAAGIEPLIVERSVPTKSGARFYARLLGNLASSLPYSVATHTSPALTAAVRDLSNREKVDLWHCEWTPYAQTMRTAFDHSPPFLVMAHNVESLIWQRYVEAESNPAKRWYIQRQFRKFEKFEQWAYSTADRTVAVSLDDAKLICERFGATRVDVVDNGVDVAYFQPAPALARDPYQILFLGSLDWRPNLDGVQMLLDTVFPIVRQQEPRAKLVLVGRQPPAWLRERVNNEANVELHANVPDVRTYLHSSGMLAVPLRIGGGSRLKILEALATGLPVVTTRVGVEGLLLEPDRHVTVTETVEQMSEAILNGMKSARGLQLQATRGRQRILERYDWDPLAKRLEEVWGEVVQGASVRKRVA